ncbi:hypothetical protein BN1708_016390 [Verticillium longisporum]|uniref:Uncharacterized protein n=1 Tax=Verticillium longisporum TaxID=100787 RepID=A0A0G4MLT4_VERLO|nr:hypothetical protein BN1708_016390 [Verticillium longisporum]
MTRMLDALPLRQHIILTRNSAATHKQLVDNTISQDSQIYGACMRIRRATQQCDTSLDSLQLESGPLRGAPRPQMSGSPASSPMTSNPVLVASNPCFGPAVGSRWSYTWFGPAPPVRLSAPSGPRRTR